MANWHKFDRGEGAVFVNFDNVSCIRVAHDKSGRGMMTEICYPGGSIEVTENIMEVMELARSKEQD